MPTANANHEHRLRWIVPLVAIVVAGLAYFIGSGTLSSSSSAAVDEGYFRAAVYEHRPPSFDKKDSIPETVEKNFPVYLKAIEAAAKEVSSAGI